VVRYDLIPCYETPGSIFGVMDPKTKRLDWRFENLFLNINAREGAEIMLYNGKAYMFGWESAWKIVMLYEGRRNICRFEYVKEDKP